MSDTLCALVLNPLSLQMLVDQLSLHKSLAFFFLASLLHLLVPQP
nr:hypothetical protein [Xanthomonas translucens]